MDNAAGVQPGHRILGRYEIVRHIADGGMGSVWECRDLALNQAVALKRVRFANLSGPDATQTRLRTLREARLAAQLRGHPHVVSIYDVQEADGDVWLVLEYLPSRSLADITDNGECIPVGEAARIGAAVADALAAAHSRGIVHRDVKPGNVLISRADGTVKLTDFGISHGVGEHPLTATDAVAGTPAYMSREVARGEGETPASDVYSLGATLYRAVEGRTPYGDGGNSLQMLYQAANGTIAPPQRAGSFTPLLMQFLALDPAARPAAAHAVRLLDEVARRGHAPTMAPGPGTPPPWPPPFPPPGPPGMPPGTRPRRRGRIAAIGAAALLVAALVAGGVLYLNRPDPTAIPELPSSVGPQALTGNVKDADPCALLDPVVMGRFGSPSRLGPGGEVGRCRVTVGAAAARLFTDISFTRASVTAPPGPGSAPPQDLGGVKILRFGVSSTTCVNNIQLGDGTYVFIQTLAPSGTPPNLCEVGEAAVRVAVNKLAESGISYRPGWQSAISLADKDACTLAGDALTQVPGLDTNRRVGGSAGGYCYIGVQEQGRPYVYIYLGLENSGSLARYGTVSTVGGETVYTSKVTPNGPNPAACAAYLLHKPNYDGGASGPAEYIAVIIDGSQADTQLCGRATTIALAAEKNASA